MPPIIDAHVQVGRNTLLWSHARRELESAGVVSAMLSASPDSPHLDDDRELPLALARPGGPFALYYIGGRPFCDTMPGPPKLPEDIAEYDGVYWHCALSPSLDYGGSRSYGYWDDRDVGTVIEATGVLPVLERLQELRLPVRMQEHLPVVEAVRERLPRLRLIIPSLGRTTGGVTAVTKRMAGDPRVWFDTSNTELNEAVVKRLGYERLLYASSYPSGTPAENIRRVKLLRISPTQQQAILGENLLRLLNR